MTEPLTALADALRNMTPFVNTDRLVLDQAAAHFDTLVAADEKMPVVAWRHKTHAHGRWLITQMTPEQAAQWNSVFDSDPLVRQSDALAAIAAVTAERDALRDELSKKAGRLPA